MNIKDLTLNTPVYNYYYGKGIITDIHKDVIYVEFLNMFMKATKFKLAFVTDVNDFYGNNKRHINELSLTDYEKTN
jgi:hypothetical protein